MGRIFWRAFLAVWLTMVGAILIIAIINSYLQVLPPKDRFIEGRIYTSLEILAGMIEDDRIEPAKALTANLRKLNPPIDIHIVAAPDVVKSSCFGKRPNIRMVYAPAAGTCFRFDVPQIKETFFDRYMPVILPPAAALIASIISSFLLADYLAKPILTLREALRTLAGGVFSVRIGNTFGKRRDEIASLGADFDITAAKLEELHAGQRRLFHDVSHELRSPLSRLQAAVGLVRRNPAKFEAMMPRMQQEMERLDRLVEEILTLARVGEEVQSGSWQDIDVIDLLGAIVDDATFEGHNRNIAVIYNAPDHFIATVNGELIYRAIENVVRNAIKYSPDGGSVRIIARLADQGDSLEIAISNGGKIVPGAEIERIFEPFVRLEENGGKDGYGLGLAITQRSIESHGGRVSAIANPDGGLTILLTVPRGPRPASA